jgi:hypothetical protein
MENSVNLLKVKSFAALLVLALFGTVSFAAQSCPHFAGQYLNIADPKHPLVGLKQSACDSITIVDNGGISWPLYLDGRVTQVSDSVFKTLGVSAKGGAYTARMDDFGTIIITAHTTVTLGVGSTMQVTLNIDYVGSAYMTYMGDYGRDSARIIKLSTKSFKVSSPANDQSAASFGVGFLRGANWVLDMAKSMFDAKLADIRLTL